MAKTTKRRPGPEVGGIQSANLTVRIPLSMMNRLMAHCAEAGLSRATAIQFALDRYLDRFEVKEGK